MATWTRDDAAGAAFQRGDGPVIIGASARDAAIAFAEALFEEHPGLAGVVGSPEACEAFNAVWLARSGGVARLRLRLRDHVLEQLAIPCFVPGSMRAGTAADRDWLLDMVRAFVVEVNVPDSPATIERNLDQRLAAGGYRIWNDGEDVACAGFRVAGEDVGRVAPVYTRPPFRSRGYASALVSAICAELVEARREVFLVTDVANPTSNALYARLGFVPLAESCHFDLVEPD